MKSSTYLTTVEAAEYLRSTPAYIRKLAYLRKLPHYKAGGRKNLFAVADLDAYVQAGRIASADELADRACAILNGGTK